MRPCFEECQECRYWDDVNGCWANCEQIGDSNCTGDYISNLDNQEEGDQG